MIDNLLGRLPRPANLTKASKRRSRRRRELEQLRQSSLFDRAWYLDSYPDVRDSGVDPVLHYLESGWREGRDPGPAFCTSAYLRANPDVAAAQVNPLLHYLVHGHVEGRGAVDHASPLRALVDPLELFGPAAPCARFPVCDQAPRRWTRAGRIPRDENSVLVRGLTIGTPSEEVTSEAVDEAFQLLSWLSGCRSDGPAHAQLTAGETIGLLDAWHAGHGMLRTRWAHGSKATVVRAVQHFGEECELIGEGCIGGTLDFVDLRPRNPFFPILFLFTDPEGLLRGFRLIAFPGMWRGGLYYAERLALAMEPPEGALSDLSGTDEWLARRLIALRTGKVRALVAATEVLLDRADGTHPLFRSAYRAWLARVMQMPVHAAGPADDRTTAYLKEAIELSVTGPRESGIARLKIQSDMIPSLSALTESAREGAISQELVGSLIAAPEDPATAATCVDVPPALAAALLPGCSDALPSLVSCTAGDGLAAEVGLLAIRAPAKRKASEAELLVPNSARDSGAPASSAISWVIWPGQWRDEQLAMTLQSLALQTTGVPSVIFVGRPQDGTFEIAQRLFGAKLIVAPAVEPATDAIQTDFAGYIGPGAILHDPKTTAVLTSLLSRSEAITISAPLVRTAVNGKVPKRVFADVTGADELELLRGATIPIGTPPAHFFISRSETFSKLARGADTGVAGQHLCSTVVSVSFLGGPVEESASFPLPQPASAISMRSLVG